MGCHSSCLYDDSLTCNEMNANKTNKWKNRIATTHSLFSLNEDEIDLSHFMLSDKIIGVGGFGIVRVATKRTGKENGCIYALKSLSKASVLQRNSGHISVLTELKALTILQGYLATGGDMRFNLRNAPLKRFSEGTSKFYFCQIVLALDACHRNFILHRDIKPENIVMTEQGYVKLTDFGVAKILDDIEDCRSTSGTHGYIAPEVYLPTHRHGRAADWFSLGITLYEFLIGKRPFETSRLTAFRDNPYNQDALELNSLNRINFISEQCKDFLSAILQVQPSKRLGSTLGLQEFINHKWLRGSNWESISNQTFPAPFKPDTSFDRCDVKNDELRENIHLHFQQKSIRPEDDAVFEEYRFRNQMYIVRADEPTELHQEFDLSTHARMSWEKGKRVSDTNVSTFRVENSLGRYRDGLCDSTVNRVVHSKDNGHNQFGCLFQQNSVLANLSNKDQLNSSRRIQSNDWKLNGEGMKYDTLTGPGISTHSQYQSQSQLQQLPHDINDLTVEITKTSNQPKFSYINRLAQSSNAQAMRPGEILSNLKDNVIAYSKSKKGLSQNISSVQSESDGMNCIARGIIDPRDQDFKNARPKLPNDKLNDNNDIAVTETARNQQQNVNYILQSLGLGRKFPNEEDVFVTHNQNPPVMNWGNHLLSSASIINSSSRSPTIAMSTVPHMDNPNGVEITHQTSKILSNSKNTEVNK